MELDFQFQDENTSCSSSPTNTISEEIDDLRLGAEANSFPSKPGDQDPNDGINLIQKFIILKESTDLYAPRELNCGFSTIKSISELIDARKGNPEDMLLSLGFVTTDGEDSHSSILSRFQYPQKVPGDVKTFLLQDEPARSRIGPEIDRGITKTKEWLENQQNMNVTTTQCSNPKESTCSNKVIDQLILPQQSESRRSSAQRKRRRFSKSRQSSFELLLPNLKEEDMMVDDTKLDDSFKENFISPDTNLYPGEALPPTEPDIKDNNFLEYPSISLIHQSPWDHLRPRKIKEKVDSFELEEIASNEGTPTYETPRSWTRKIEKSTINSHFNDQCDAFDQQATDYSFSSNSSSGFDEGDSEEPLSTLPHAEKKQHQDINANDVLEEVIIFSEIFKRNSQKEKLFFMVVDYAHQLSCAVLSYAFSDYLQTISKHQQDEYYSTRAKIACAGGIAEAALRLRQSYLKSDIESAASGDPAMRHFFSDNAVESRRWQHRESMHCCQRRTQMTALSKTSCSNLYNFSGTVPHVPSSNAELSYIMNSPCSRVHCYGCEKSQNEESKFSLSTSISGVTSLSLKSSTTRPCD